MSTYRFTGKIGEGGMAEVFSAVQEDLERPVAIKMLKPWFVADPSFLEERSMILNWESEQEGPAGLFAVRLESID